jgi:uncharacterized protein YjbJ (UPF0337 family)
MSKPTVIAETLDCPARPLFFPWDEALSWAWLRSARTTSPRNRCRMRSRGTGHCSRCLVLMVGPVSRGNICGQRAACRQYLREPRRGSAMGLGKKITHSAEKSKGRMKKDTGRATGNRSLEAKGKGEQTKGGLKQVGQNIKDAFKR